jgi:membrane-associated phospholipid phosphatase
MVLVLAGLAVAAAPPLAGDDAWARDAAVTGGLLTGWAATEFTPLKETLAPDACRWCVPDAFDLSVRRAVLEDDPGQAAAVSNLVGLGVLPAAGVASALVLVPTDVGWDGEGWGVRGRDALYVTEAIAAAAAINQAAKLSFGRERPFVWAGDADPSASAHERADYDLSFYSGHTTLAFASVGAVTSVAWLRGSRLWWVPAVVGAPIAGTVGYLRMAADKHWFSDVATGALIGTAVGVATPLVFHPRVGDHDVGLWVTGGDAPMMGLRGAF